MQTLLDLDGELIVLEHGYWVKFEAQKITADERRPYGIGYSLTLHAPDGTRVLGYDNAHAFKQSGFKGKGRNKKQLFDHRHKGTRTFPYQWIDAEQLVIDFWSEVENYLKKDTPS